VLQRLRINHQFRLAVLLRGPRKRNWTERRRIIDTEIGPGGGIEEDRPQYVADMGKAHDVKGAGETEARAASDEKSMLAHAVVGKRSRRRGDCGTTNTMVSETMELTMPASQRD